MEKERAICLLRSYGYRVWGNGMGRYWLFAENFYPGYEGYMGQYVGYASHGDLLLLIRELEALHSDG